MIFIDTGAFIARYLANDQFHDQAIECWNSLGKSQRRCFTSNFVIDETLTLLARRSSYEFAAERGRILLGSTELTILRPDEHDETDALDYFEKFADQNVSFTDCVSFVLMERHKIPRVFGFDRHFSLASFDVEP